MCSWARLGIYLHQGRDPSAPIPLFSFSPHQRPLSLCGACWPCWGPPCPGRPAHRGASAGARSERGHAARTWKWRGAGIYLSTASSLWASHLRASLCLLHWSRGKFSAVCCGRQDLNLPLIFPRGGAKGEEKEGCINEEESFWKLPTTSGKRPCLYLSLLVLNLGLLLLSCLVYIC